MRNNFLQYWNHRPLHLPFLTKCNDNRSSMVTKFNGKKQNVFLIFFYFQITERSNDNFMKSWIIYCKNENKWWNQSLNWKFHSKMSNIRWQHNVCRLMIWARWSNMCKWQYAAYNRWVRLIRPCGRKARQNLKKYLQNSSKEFDSKNPMFTTNFNDSPKAFSHFRENGEKTSVKNKIFVEKTNCELSLFIEPLRLDIKFMKRTHLYLVVCIIVYAVLGTIQRLQESLMKMKRIAHYMCYSMLKE